MSSTIPIVRQLSQSSIVSGSELYATNLSAATNVGVLDQLIGLALWGTIYLIAFIITLRSYPPNNRNNGIYIMLLLLILPGALSLFFTKYFLASFTIFIHLLGAALIGLASAHLLVYRRGDFLKTFQQIIILCLLGHIFFSILQPEYGLSYLGRLQGGASNANSLARVALTGLLVSIAFRTTNSTRILGLFTIFICWVVLFWTSSITAIAAAALGSIFLFVVSKFSVLKKNPTIIIYALIFTSPLLILLINLLQESFLFISNRENTFTGRTFIWAKGVELISLKPILGWGYGDMADAFKESMIAVSSFHNGFLDILVKGGFISLSLFIIKLIIYFNKIKTANLLDRLPCMCFALAFLTYNITESTIYSPKNSMWIALCIFIFFTFLSVRKYKSSDD